MSNSDIANDKHSTATFPQILSFVYGALAVAKNISERREYRENIETEKTQGEI